MPRLIIRVGLARKNALNHVRFGCLQSLVVFSHLETSNISQKGSRFSNKVEYLKVNVNTKDVGLNVFSDPKYVSFYESDLKLNKFYLLASLWVVHRPIDRCLIRMYI